MSKVIGNEFAKKRIRALRYKWRLKHMTKVRRHRLTPRIGDI